MNMSKELSHAYIIAAQPDEGYRAARKLAQTLLCTGVGGSRPCGLCRDCRKAAAGIHPDIMVTERLKDDKGKEKREIYVEQVREIIASAPILPNEAEKKVYIIRDAGTMKAPAQNALLKILEEPPHFAAFILVADSAGQLLETVRSRCVTLRENGEDSDPGEEARERAARWLNTAASGDRFRLLTLAGEFEAMSAEQALGFVRAAKLQLTDALCGRAGIAGFPRGELLRLTQLMTKAEEYFRFNVSVKHVLGLLSVESIVK